MSQPREDPQDDLARFLGAGAVSEWRALLAHLDFHQGFGLFVLLLPAKAGAALCEQALAHHFLASGRELARVRFADPAQLLRLPETLLDHRVSARTAAVWVDLLDPASRTSPEWQPTCRRALGLLNQHRNRLAARLPVPVLFVGEPWLQPAFREAAPDLGPSASRSSDWMLSQRKPCRRGNGLRAIPPLMSWRPGRLLIRITP